MTRDRRQLVRAGLLLGLGAGALALGGCQRALFPQNEPRSQFQAYDTMRNRYTPLEETDVFGKPRPALRARLNNVD